MRDMTAILCLSVLSLAAPFAPQARAAAPAIKLEAVAQLEPSPISISNAADGSGRLFILLKAGQIVIYSDGVVLPVPFLDITDRVSDVNEQGLLGLAFHPNYADNGRFYVYYSGLDGNAVVSRFNVSANDPDVADPDSESLVLGIDNLFLEHYAGQLQFGPDAYLYIASGDGGPGGDPFDQSESEEARGQDPAHRR